MEGRSAGCALMISGASSLISHMKCTSRVGVASDFRMISWQQVAMHHADMENVEPQRWIKLKLAIEDTVWAL